MILEILLATIVGVIAGTFTGLVPGVHVNLIAALLLASAAMLIPLFGVTAVIAFIIAMAVTHSFISVVPSIFLGAPDAAMALSVLPGHKLLLEGRGVEAVRFTQIGSLAAVILSLALFPLFVWIIQRVNTDYVPFVLLGLVVFLLLQEFSVASVVCFLSAGILGLLVFRLPGLENSLFPLLSGLFGISTLLLSLENNEFPEQKSNKVPLPAKSGQSIIVGQVVGFVAAFMPGLGTASAAAIAEPFVKAKEEGFLLLIGIISTVNFVLSLATFYVLDKARNGAIVAVKELVEPSFPFVLLAVGVVAVAAGLASIALTHITVATASLCRKINYVKLAVSIILILMILTFLLSGWRGFLVLIPAVALGVLAPLINVPRRFLMGCLLIPVLTYFF